MDPSKWKSVPWEDQSNYQGSLPTNLRDFVAQFVEGELDEREKARDFFRQWPIESRRYVGQLGVIPRFMALLRGLIAWDREDAHLDIDLFSSYLAYLADYESETSFYDGSPEDFRGSIIAEAQSAYELLLSCIKHQRELVREAAIRSFITWQKIREMKELCQGKVEDVIHSIVENDNCPNCVSYGIRFLVSTDRLNENQLRELRDSPNFQIHLTASWALCKIGKLENHPDSLESICKYSLASSFPIPGITENLESLGHKDKWEVLGIANEFRFDLRESAEIRCAELMLGVLGSFKDDTRFAAYRFVFENMFWEPSRWEKSPVVYHKSRLLPLRNNLIRMIARDEQLWSMTERSDRVTEWLQRASLPASRQGLEQYLVSSNE